MSKPLTCRTLIKRAVAEGKLPEMSPSALEELISEAETIRLRVGEAKGVLGEDFRNAMMSHLENKRFQRIRAAREAKENLIKHKLNSEYMAQDRFKGAPDKAILGKLLGGTIGYSKGGNRGAVVVGESRHNQRMTGLHLALREGGLLELAEAGRIDRDVAQEMFLMDEGRSGETKNPFAQQMAKHLRAVTDSLLKDKQAAGSGVTRAKNYIAKMTHDRNKLAEAGFQKWNDTILPLLDREKTFGAFDDEKIASEMKQIYEHIVLGEPPQGVIEARGKNLAKEQALARTFIFKDGHAWADYNAQFSRSNLLETIVAESRKGSKHVGLMEQFGTNPEVGFRKMVKEAQDSLRDNPDAHDQFMKKIPELEAAFVRARGFSDSPGTSLAARAAANTRIWMSIAKTGSAALSTGTDLAFAATRIASQTTGKNLLAQSAQNFTDFLNFAGSSGQREAVARRLGIMVDNFGAELLSKFGAGDTEPGVMSRSMRLFHRLNGMKVIDQAAAVSTAFSHAAELAEHAGRAWDKLDARVQLSLERYGIGPREWELARQGVQEANGTKIVTPEGVAGLSDEAVRAVFGGEGVNPNKVRFGIENSLLSLFNESAAAGASRASQRVQHHLLGASVDDGGWGTLRRLWAQFKQPILMNTRTMLDTVMSNPSTRPSRIRDALNPMGPHRGDFYGFGNLFIVATMLGYLKIVAQEGVSGRTPPDPLNPEVMLKSMVNGGALSMYSDYLFSELHRNYGQGALEIAAGPALGEGAKMLDLGRKAIQGEASWNEVWKRAWANTPGHNLIYFKAGADYLISNNINEMLNPGYKMKLEKMARETPGLLDDTQTYFMFQPTR